MFILSFKLKNQTKKILIFTIFIVIFSTIAIFSYNIQKGKYVNANKKPITLIADSNKSRKEFFNTYGWETSNEAIEINDVAIPHKFDEVYSEYNNIQKKQNMDLSKYKGKMVKQYIYEITNYPLHPKGVRGDMLVYGGQIIACTVYSLELNGFMHAANEHP